MLARSVLHLVRSLLQARREELDSLIAEATIAMEQEDGLARIHSLMHLQIHAAFQRKRAGDRATDVARAALLDLLVGELRSSARREPDQVRKEELLRLAQEFIEQRAALKIDEGFESEVASLRARIRGERPQVR